MTPASPPRDRGAALLSILMIVAVMSVAALTAVDALGRSISLARVSSERSQTLWAARSTEAIADDTSHIRLQALLEAQGLFRSDARALAESVADWIDTDASPRAFGAEDGYYGTLETPYRAANARLVNLSELRAIKGFTPEIIETIRPLVCVRPSTFQSALNIETLHESDAPLLIALYSGELSMEQAQSVIRARPLSGWLTLDTFLADSEIQSIAVAARNDSMIALRPTSLRLTARIVSGPTQETLQLTYAMDEGGKAILVQRTTGDL